MKEATGEANMTVITVVLIAVVAAVASPLVTGLLNRTKLNACCAEAGMESCSNSACKGNTACSECLDETDNKNTK